MKKIQLYISLAACLGLTFASCNKSDWEDATSAHSYSESESPYLRLKSNAVVTYDLQFKEGAVAPKYIYLKDNAEIIQTQLGMTVDDMISAYTNGSILFSNINSARGVWNKADYTYGNSGWWYNSAGGVVSESEGVAYVAFDSEKKALVVSVPEQSEAGVSASATVGFVNADYSDYARFNVNIAVSNPGLITENVQIPEGDYAAFLVDFTKKETTEKIENAMGMTVKEFVKAIKEGEDIALYMVKDKKFITEYDGLTAKDDGFYTANGLGYWLDADGNRKSWGAGCQVYVESDPDGYGVNIGRYPGVASGTKQVIDFAYVSLTDESKFIEFIITATFE
ncbi:MAG: DUF4859 domain-containing protein [Bacteroidales bacterium]|nr:DUF4859 domain-containing protein [Bacteroidales bacterium]